MYYLTHLYVSTYMINIENHKKTLSNIVPDFPLKPTLHYLAILDWVRKNEVLKDSF